MEVEFVVEQAGCESCGERVGAALSALGVVREIELDAADDSATVRADFSESSSRDDVDRALLEASAGAGHEYRVRPGSWQTAA